MKEKNLTRLAALSLAALLLAGCSAGGEKETEATPTPAPEESEEVRDYSKYNAYLTLAEEIDDLEEALDAYFANVNYDETFSLAEGGEYAAMKDVLSDYIPNTYPVTDALSYIDEEPAYAKVDAAVRALGESPAQVMDAMRAIGNYLRFDDYEEDNMAQAPQLHADLWDALEVYDTYYSDFVTAIDEMVAEGRDEDEADLLEDGELVLYNSTCMIHASQDFLSNMDDQIYTAYLAALEAGEEEFEYPAIDMTDLMPLLDKFQTAYDGLNEALESEEEREKVFSGKTAEASQKLYTARVNALYTSITDLKQLLLEGGDYSETYDAAYEAANNMVDAYNSII